MSGSTWKFLFACLISASLSGCAYDRSFMQMDSNSGVPFFGFQWAVDSGSRPSTDTNHPTLNLEEPESRIAVPNLRRDRTKLSGGGTELQTVSLSSQAR